jgi:hypothetical protein
VNRKVVVPTPISKRIGEFGLSRRMFVRLLTRIHSDIPRDYGRFKNLRAQDDRCYKYRMAMAEVDDKHLFLFKIDDTTSPDDLIIIYIGHRTKAEME